MFLVGCITGQLLDRRYNDHYNSIMMYEICDCVTEKSRQIDDGLMIPARLVTEVSSVWF